LIRRRIKTPEFKTKFREIGERTRTKVCICYIDDIVSKSILSELERRLDEINIDGILDSGYIQELIRDEPFSFFETVGYSERPDVVVSRLLEGRIAIIVDGSPAVLTVPFILLEHAQSNEDYYNNYILATFNRLIRTTATISSMTIPAVYLAVVTYHQEMLPTPVLLSLSASRQGVPFPTSLSFFIMLLIFDVLRETGARMPLSTGQAINIVGALVLGEAAINAKLVSAPVVVITALSGILTLLNSRLLTPIIFLRFFLLLAASVLGLYGVIFGFMIIILHLASMRSFGVPYLLGVTRIMHHDGQDAWIRAPWWTMTLRPKIIAARNLVRETVGKNRRR
jgi:spore germination protein KA